MAFRICLMLLLAVSVAGCSVLTGSRTDYCLSAVAVLQSDAKRIEVTAIAATDKAVTVRFLAPAPRYVTCRFEGNALSLNQLDLAGIDDNGENMGDGRLLYLKRFLAAEGVFAARDERLQLPPQGYFSVGTSLGPYLQMMLSAMPIASVYVLLALGFALVHGVTGRINIAHGQFATVGAYAGFIGFLALGAASIPLGIAGAALMAGIAAGCAGLLVIQSVFVPLAKREGHMLLVASVGLIIVLEEGLRITHAARELWLPPIYSSPVAITTGSYRVSVTGMQLGLAAATAITVACVFLIMRRTRFGLAWRAVADDALAARLMGLDPGRVLGTAAAMATALAGLGGLAILLGYGNASHSMGLMLSVKAMVAALIGGMGSPGGAVLGALILVTVETSWVAVFGGGYRDMAVFAMLIGLLTLAPNGLFGVESRN